MLGLKSLTGPDHREHAVNLCRVKVHGNDAFVLAASSASLARSCTPTLSLRGSSLGCMGLRGTAKTSKHFVLDLMAATRADNTLARIEMETIEVGVCVWVGVCIRVFVCARTLRTETFSLLNLSHCSLSCICQGLVSVCDIRLITHIVLLVQSVFLFCFVLFNLIYHKGDDLQVKAA